MLTNINCSFVFYSGCLAKNRH